MITGLVRLLQTARLDLVLFVLPPAVLLARCGGTGGWLLLPAWCALAVAFGVMHGAAHDRPFRAPPLAPTADAGARSRRGARAMLVVSLALALAASLVLLFVRTPVGIYALLGLCAAALWTSSPRVDASRSRAGAATSARLRGAPLWWPMGLVIVPAVLLGLESRSLEPFAPGRDAPQARQSEEPGADKAGARAAGPIQTRHRFENPASIGRLAACAMCAAWLAVYVLVLSARDAASDRAEGARTIATVLGVPMTDALALATAFAALAVACSGASAGAAWWHWSVALAAAWFTGLLALAIGRGSHGVGAWLWLLGQSVLGGMLMASA